jgi:hypothetical protein
LTFLNCEILRSDQLWLSQLPIKIVVAAVFFVDVCWTLRWQDGDLHGKMEALQLELSQSYQKQSQLSEQLLHEVTGAQALREQLVEREGSIVQLQAELLGARYTVIPLRAQNE